MASPVATELHPEASTRLRAEPTLLERFQAVRRQTIMLAEPLALEDFVVQSMPDASPAKWHLAHTTWFFETFCLAPCRPDYRVFHESYAFLFNSYYNAVGERIARARRGILSRPPIDEVFRYRRHVDERMADLLASDRGQAAELAALVTLGLNHEQQHQELLLTDLKHAFSCNPLKPAYRAAAERSTAQAGTLTWTHYPAGLCWIGHEGPGFSFDNESPRHRVYVDPFELANRPVTVGEYLQFMESGGYEQPAHWLSDGWDACRTQGWNSPLYWEQRGAEWWTMTLAGIQRLVASEPVCHISFYEADAYARWAGARLPTEAEWEIPASEIVIAGNLLETDAFHPRPTPAVPGPQALFGDVWEWTSSPYVGYPGYQPAAGALGEYNGKFMCNQFVLRGGSCASPQSHLRATYRNFFGPSARWQFTGFRLARNA
jgi:ergothioneine biosynthesis protein EgtB